MEPNHTGEKVREKAGGLAQEGTLGFYASKLLKKRESKDLGVRELLEGGIASSLRIEMRIGVV
jgi:hypothetical protein